MPQSHARYAETHTDARLSDAKMPENASFIGAFAAEFDWRANCNLAAAMCMRPEPRWEADMRSTLIVLAFFLAIGLIGAVGFVACGGMSKTLASKTAAAEKTKKAKKTRAVKSKSDKDDDFGNGWGKKQRVAGRPLVAGLPLNGAGTIAATGVSLSSTAGMSGRAPGSQPFAAGSPWQGRRQMDSSNAESATDRMGWEIVDALEDRPTLAIWLFDRTVSASSQRAAVVRRLGDVLQGFERMKKDGHKAFENQANGPPLLSVVAAYGKSCEILTPEPTDDAEAIAQALHKITDEPDGNAMTFTAIQTVLDKFLKYRTEEKRLILLTVVTAQRGDDSDKVDPLVPTLEKYAIPCYVIGPPAPFGREGTVSGASGGKGGIQVGPESMAKEMVGLDFPSAMGGGFGGGFRGNQSAAASDVFDSGFGAFGLARLAKLSGGSYLIVRGGFGDFGAGAAKRCDPKIMARYAPDYVSKAEYDALLAENKCRMALHNAAMLEPIEIYNNVNLTLSFVRADEPKIKAAADVAQRPVARIEPLLTPLYRTLAAGESDRAKLTGPRWQAAYDLAMGRVLAARAHYEGYNTIVAQIKQGKRPGGPENNVWVIVPANSFNGDSTIDKLVKQSRKYLERVVKEHPGTPWEMMATRELNSVCGWECVAK